MEIQIALPDEIANSLKSKWGNLERRLLEITLIQAYREGLISVGKLRELLGVSTRLEMVSYFSLGQGDYTQERQQWLGQTSLEEVLTEMKQTPETDPNQYEEIIE